MKTIALLAVLAVGQTTDVTAVRPRALAGDAAAARQLGLAYQSGSGVPQDKVEACKWLRIAKANDAVVAIERDMTEDERGDAADRAELWLHHGDALTRADRGYLDAVRARAIAYRDGQGVAKDEVAALAWAVAGSIAVPARDPRTARLEEEFGALEKKLAGRDVEILTRAGQLGKRFAENGNVHAQIWLADGYSRKNAIGNRLAKQDFVESYKWIDVAEARANGAPLGVPSPERARGFMEALMTPEQLAEAKQRSREWLAAFERRR